MSDITFIKHKMTNILNISKIVTIHYFELDKNYKFEGESHDFWEMVYVDKGEIIITAKNKKHLLRQGEVVFHKPNEFHNLCANDVTAPNVFIITFVCNSAAMKFFRNKMMKLPAKLRGLIASIIEESEKTFDMPCFNPRIHDLTLKQNSPIGGQQLVRLYLEQLLIMIIRNDSNNLKTKNIFHSKESMENHFAASMISFMEKNICNQLTISDICKHMNYGKTFLCTTFKNATGCGVMEYYTKLKIDYAKKLIREKDYNISQISNILMFDNVHYFSRTFKRITNMTPTEYFNSIKVD